MGNSRFGWGLGIEGMVIGAAITAGGLVTYLVGRNQVRLIGERASASSQIELELGFTPSGIGLALISDRWTKSKEKSS